LPPEVPSGTDEIDSFVRDRGECETIHKLGSTQRGASCAASRLQVTRRSSAL